MMKRGQAVSIDLILAVLIFVSIIVGFFYVIGIFSERSGQRDIQNEADLVTPSLQQNISKFSFISGNNIDTQKLNAFSEQGYRELQNSLGLASDFCIFLEDDKGNIIPINNKPGIGSDKVYLGGDYRCGVDIT